MDLPALPSSEVVWYQRENYDMTAGTVVLERWPTIPYELLVMTKLQAWSQRRSSTIQRYRDREPADRSDIEQLLTIGKREGRIIFPAPGHGEYLSDDFVMLAKFRIAEHLAAYPWYMPEWRRMGYKGLSGVESEYANTLWRQSVLHPW